MYWWSVCAQRLRTGSPLDALLVNGRQRALFVAAGSPKERRTRFRFERAGEFVGRLPRDCDYAARTGYDAGREEGMRASRGAALLFTNQAARSCARGTL